MPQKNFVAVDIEENALLAPFSHQDYWDLDVESKIYISSFIGSVSNESLIKLFVKEVLKEQYYDSLRSISEKKARHLLRQMAMFEITVSNKRNRSYTSSEAKLASRLLIEFIGESADFFTNVLSIEFPHDNAGLVMSADSDGMHDAISFFGINSEYLFFIN